jgi:hypothetical protein
MMGDSLRAVEAVAPKRRTRSTKRTVLLPFMKVPSVKESDLYRPLIILLSTRRIFVK